MPGQKDNRESEKEVLDLIGSKPKRPRKKQQVEPAAAGETPVPATDTPVKQEKKQALDLLSGKKKSRPQPETPAEPVAESPEVDSPLPSADSNPGVVEPGGVINLKPPVSVSDLAAMMGIKPFRLIKDLMGLGIFGNPSTVIDAEVVGKLCDIHGFVFEREKREKGGGVKPLPEVPKEPDPVPVVEEPKEVLKIRTPIITVMGHVDHGKTSLLDYIRRSRVAKGEAGGITQHIGAYSVDHGGQLLTFIDTPGHAIFTEMRARGADVTDIVVLVVAANDGIMPQTREAIAHAKAAKKTVIVAINKCDLPAADPMKTKTGLMEEGLVPTDFGGDIECVEVSALTGAGIPDLLDLLVLQAEVLELKANPKANCRASIIEARVEQGRGSSATAIVESGTIKVGMPFICGPFAGKVRSLNSDSGKKIKSAGPGTPVEIIGFAETPNVGDELVEMENERAAKKLAEERQLDLRATRLNAPRKSRMEDIRALMGDGSQKVQLKLLLKADVQGSVEAIRKAIEDIKSEKVECHFIQTAAGPISESDILLASSSDAVVLGFNVKVESNAVRMVKREGVQVKLYSIVYELIDQVRDTMLGLLEPETRETIIGHADVKQVFKLNKGRAAGCMVSDGKVQRTCEARVLRDGQAIFDGKMSTLRRFQDEVDEVKAGLECGIRLGDFNEYEEGDVIECYTLEKIKQTL
ncbi:translation initiation factor IF-2 [Akkermansia sp. N21169]|jgi:translation initiation factor IF-2|uniref:translation initiation factor IF-2 n=1 Tax=Akkermansia sp. N21169 TaxID=3040765 RepID=UPI00244ED6BA|nr:translation initiation factor IF-2 [Akkermansia sp. N21169]MDH3067961.1 translation initiation factor IF-2 [Akkermansia sp. N21169]